MSKALKSAKQAFSILRIFGMGDKSWHYQLKTEAWIVFWVAIILLVIWFVSEEDYCVGVCPMRQLNYSPMSLVSTADCFS